MIIQMANKPMKRYIVTREMQIKLILRFQFTPVRKAIIKGGKEIKCWCE
jgi:hypothetical protein